MTHLDAIKPGGAPSGAPPMTPNSSTHEAGLLADVVRLCPHVDRSSVVAVLDAVLRLEASRGRAPCARR
jgi:hypothetical protein